MMKQKTGRLVSLQIKCWMTKKPEREKISKARGRVASSVEVVDASDKIIVVMAIGL